MINYVTTVVFSLAHLQSWRGRWSVNVFWCRLKWHVYMVLKLYIIQSFIQPSKTTKKNVPTATMPDSRLPDISLQILFSMSLPHICWYSWKTDKEMDHRSDIQNIQSITIIVKRVLKKSHPVQLWHWKSRSVLGNLKKHGEKITVLWKDNTV